MQVQYGSRVSFCESIAEVQDADDDTLLSFIADLAQSGGLDYDQYDAKALSDTTIDVDNNMRQWSYQYCSEFGFYQTPNTVEPMRSEELYYDFWPDYCGRIFGETTMEATTDQTNKIYGGLDITGDNIFFLNGSEDPW